MAQGNLAGPIGQPLDRVDGRLKVTGQAPYAYEYAAQGQAAYGFIVSASIGKGRVIDADVTDAERAPGVLLVLTKDNAPAQTPWGPIDMPDRFARADEAADHVDREHPLQALHAHRPASGPCSPTVRSSSVRSSIDS